MNEKPKMSDKPIWITQFNRPAGTEIKHIGNRWYLYERLSVYDKEKKRKRKKSGRCLGAITEDGLKPSRRNSPLAQAAPRETENLEYGATAFLLGLTGPMRKRLAALFPDCWRELFAMALLKCKERSRFRRMDFHYGTSFMAQCLGGLHLSAGRVTELLRHVGTDRGAIREYMKGDLPSDGLVMFDGHRLISGSGTLEYARVGYDSRCRFLPQVNLLYMFSVSGLRKLPVYYKQYAGDVPDVSAFSDIVADAGLRKRDVTVIADKGFESGLNEALLDDASLGYVLAVRRGCAGVPEIPSSPDRYEKAFNCRGRAIYCNEYRAGKDRLFLYYDMSLANDEAVDFITRTEKANNAADRKREAEDRRRRKDKGRLSREEYERLAPVDVAEALQSHRGNGTFILKTNKGGINCAQAYCLYKTRQDIEQAFKSYDDTLDGAAGYMRDQYSFEAWLFVNHLALQMLYEVIGALADKELTDKYSFEDVMAFLKHVRANRIDGEWRLTKITRHTAKLCKELGIELEEPEKLMVSLK